MAKFNWKVFKKGKTIYWVIGAIVLFVVFYLIASSGSGSKSSNGPSGVTVLDQGPSDTAIAAQAAVTQQQIAGHYDLAKLKEEAGAAVAIAQISGNTQDTANSLAAQTAMNLASLEAGIQTAAINADLESIRLQSEYGLESARVAGQFNLAIHALDADVARTQLLEQTAQLAIAKNTEYNLGVLDYQLGMREIDASEKLGIKQLDTNLAIKGLETSVLLGQIQAGVDVAEINAGVARTQILSGERTITQQLQSQERMFSASLATQENIAQINADTFIDQSLINQASNLKKKDRDNFLISLATGSQYRGVIGSYTGIPAV